MIIKQEYLPQRCEVCHQVDCFDPLSGNCSRCHQIPELEDLIQSSDEQYQGLNSLENRKRHATKSGFYCGVASSIFILSGHGFGVQLGLLSLPKDVELPFLLFMGLFLLGFGSMYCGYVAVIISNICHQHWGISDEPKAARRTFYWVAFSAFVIELFFWQLVLTIT